MHNLVDERGRKQRKVFDLEVAYRVGGFSACILVIVPILVMLQVVATVFILCPIAPTFLTFIVDVLVFLAKSTFVNADSIAPMLEVV
jgi:hypothetical protein